MDPHARHLPMFIGHPQKSIVNHPLPLPKCRWRVGFGNVCMMEELLKGMEVAEVYSRPRVVEMARRMGLRAGWSLDLTTCDEDGKSWDFNQLEMRNKAVRK